MKNLTRKDITFIIIPFIAVPILMIVMLGSIFSAFNSQNKVPANTPICYPISSPESTILELKDLPPDANAQTSSISTIRNGQSFQGQAKSLENQKLINSDNIWRPTQYDKGDINQKTYIVQLGDTLWQIANGYYGDGEQWTKILNTNSSQIGFLPDGEQALIVPGQMLILPN